MSFSFTSYYEILHKESLFRLYYLYSSTNLTVFKICLPANQSDGIMNLLKIVYTFAIESLLISSMSHFCVLIPFQITLYNHIHIFFCFIFIILVIPIFTSSIMLCLYRINNIKIARIYIITVNILKVKNVL